MVVEWRPRLFLAMVHSVILEVLIFRLSITIAGGGRIEIGYEGHRWPSFDRLGCGLLEICRLFFVCEGAKRASYC